jgi:hypothetical protein
MSAERQRTVTVRLTDVDELFEEPETDADRYVSGIEELYRAVKAQTRVVKQPRSYQVRIELPFEQITDGLAEEVSAKLKRYCQFKVEESQQGLQTLRLQGLDSIRVGVFVLVPCLLLGVLCTWLSQTGINNVLQALFIVVAGVFVLSAGWVALWMPAELFLYDTWPFQQDIRVYQQIAAAEVVISERWVEASADEAPGAAEPALSRDEAAVPA